ARVGIPKVAQAPRTWYGVQYPWLPSPPYLVRGSVPLATNPTLASLKDQRYQPLHRLRTIGTNPTLIQKWGSHSSAIGVCLVGSAVQRQRIRSKGGVIGRGHMPLLKNQEGQAT